MLRRLLFSVGWAYVFAACTGVLMGIVAGLISLLEEMKVLELRIEVFSHLGALTGQLAVILGCLGFILSLLGKLPPRRKV